MKEAFGVARAVRSVPDPLRRGWIAVFVMVVLGAVPDAPAVGEVLQYGCILSDDQEVPPASSSALGGGSFRIDTDANTLEYEITFTGLRTAETAAHIHGYADPGASAGVVHALPAGNPKTGTWNYPESDEANILAGRAYVNVHSSTFPGGEIRGQIVPLNATIDGDQEVPPTGSPATGWGTFTVDDNLNELHYYIAFSGLAGTETAAHIHGMALHGANAGVMHALPAGSPKIGTWVYPESAELAIMSGQMYVNIHSNLFPGGEIRGQIVPVVVPIHEGQETPPTGSPAAGIGLLSISIASNAMSYDVRFAGLMSAETGAHIHGFALRGESGGVLHPLPLGTPKIGVWSYAASEESQILGGETYINIHSSVFPAGEIRGQIEGFFVTPIVAVSGPDSPQRFLLARNFPNPFETGTTIRFSLTEPMPVRLMLYDTQGRVVRTLVRGEMSAGIHPVEWDGLNESGQPVASGVYQYVLETPEGRTVRRLALLR